MRLLKNSDEKRHGTLAKNLREGSYLSQNEYPQTVAAMYEFNVKHSRHLRNEERSEPRRPRTSNGTMFAQKGSSSRPEKNDTRELLPGVDGNTHDVECYACGQRGHYASNYPKAQVRSRIRMFQKGISLIEAKENVDIVNKDWLLLDTCSKRVQQ